MGIVGALITRELRAHPNDAVLTAIKTGGLLGSDRLGLLNTGLQRQRLRGVEVPTFKTHGGLSPDGLPHPATGDVLGKRGGRVSVHDVNAVVGFVHDTGIDAFEVLVPPAQHLLQKPDARPRCGEVRVLVRPWANDGFARAAQLLHQTRHGIGVGVVPTTHDQHRGLDRARVFTHGAVPPIRVAVRVFEPLLNQEGFMGQARQPHLAPTIAHDQGVGRPRRISEHGRGPAHVFVQQRAALVVNVVLVAVIRGAQRHNGGQGRRAQSRDLQGVESTPRNAEHAHFAAAPRLRGQPRDDLERIVEFLGRVLVVHQTIAVAVATDVYAHTGVAVARQIRVGERIPHHRAVALAVGQILQQGRHRAIGRVDGQPQAHGQTRTVRQGHELVFNLLDFAREGLQGLHGFEVHLARYTRGPPRPHSAECDP